ncbi:MAG: ATP-binding cassette domain-containing protein [Pseudomonadota bacterium]
MLSLEKARIMQGNFALAADVSLEPGVKYAVIGPSGAGKSTLLAALCGFLPLAAGRLLWCGDDITTQGPAGRPMTMLFQDNNLFPHLTVVQNVGLGVRPTLQLTADDTRRVEEALDRVGLADQGKKRPGALSGGQQSRAALARVLLRAQPIVLLDEPFAALGPALRFEMLDLVAELVRETGAMLLMVTHAPEDVRRIADQVVFVADGRAEPPQAAAGLLDNPPPALKAYLG